MKDPLEYFYYKYGFSQKLIKEIIFGEKYTAVLLKNGNIGLCSNLHFQVNKNTLDIKKADIEKTEFRIILNAYFNALLNYNNSYKNQADIFDTISFNKYNNIVMIGFFKSLVKKFKNEHIPLSIFDLLVDDDILTNMKLQDSYISDSDCLILSATTMFNGTFSDIVSKTKNCDIFLLGPSGILNKDMFQIKNIRIVFGSVFESNDNKVLDIIRKGGGTPDFKHLMKKVFITNNDFQLT